jgi:hypothetical protein
VFTKPYRSVQAVGQEHGGEEQQRDCPHDGPCNHSPTGVAMGGRWDKRRTRRWKRMVASVRTYASASLIYGSLPPRHGLEKSTISATCRSCQKSHSNNSSHSTITRKTARYRNTIPEKACRLIFTYFRIVKYRSPARSKRKAAEYTLSG